MIFRQLASIAGCVRSSMLAQKCRSRISEFWPRFTFQLELKIKFILITNSVALDQKTKTFYSRHCLPMVHPYVTNMFHNQIGYDLIYSLQGARQCSAHAQGDKER